MQAPATTPLDVLPSEVVEEIALHACATPFLGPPAALPVLLTLSRRIHTALCLQHNPGFHARVFRAKFDTLAPHRRFLAAGEPLTAVSYALELRRRFIGLRRIRHTANAGRFSVCSEEDERADFWMLFFMFLESDGNNYAQMHNANVTSYVRIFIRDQLMPGPRPGFPLESTMRSLGLWLMWFLTEVHAVVAEMSPDTTHIHNMLRPWVFGAFKYDMLFAPYTHYHLPASPTPSIPPIPLDADPLLLTPHYLADLDLRDRTETVIHMSRRIRVAVPPAAPAAIMAFMVRLERNGPIPSRPSVPPHVQDVGLFPPTITPTHPGLTIYPRTRFPSWQGPGSSEFDGRPNRLGSAEWDSEWLRIMSCGNPCAEIPPVLREQPKFRPGDLAGVWEGRFVFMTFDAFRDMLEGSIAATQVGPVAQQPQVWRVREHHCVTRHRRVQTSSKLTDPRNVVHNEPLPIGNPLDAYIPDQAEFFQHGEQDLSYTSLAGLSGRRLEIRVPDDSTPDGYKSYTYLTRDSPGDPVDVPGRVPVPARYQPQSGSESSGTHTVHPSQAGGDEWVETITDTIITGEGHSNWGEFRLRGRIRHWDGMITLVKDYAGPNVESRGRWLYRGYIIAGANWVGRWRDTFTAQHLNGYEGIFSVSRRQ